MVIKTRRQGRLTFFEGNAIREIIRPCGERVKKVRAESVVIRLSMNQDNPNGAET